MSSCRICSQELVVELDPEDFNEATSSAAGGSSGSVPDDLQLSSCGCHFHWQCLLDESSAIATSLTCPSCNRSISSQGSFPQPQMITKYHNEGGIQDGLDIYPLVIEEAYLEANSAARPARAAMTMYAEGDIAGIIELLKGIEEDSDEDDMTSAELLRYQDPLDEMKTGLHVAIEKDQYEVVWLLLWLASELPNSGFPEEILRSAGAMEAGRQTVQGGADIRSLKDAAGRTADEVAGSMGSWAALTHAGVLRA